MSNRREFQTHRKFLEDVVTKQAGSLEKAILEAVMNAEEAGATRVDITYTAHDNNPHTLHICDNGRGIETEEQMIKCFETFGHPHDASENKKWAQFRMGRGQCFAQGKNTWKTRGWIMTTDVKSDIDNEIPLGYILSKSNTDFPGCSIFIEMYPEKSINSVSKLGDSVREQVEFVEIDVYFNGEKVNSPPSSCKWTFEDENAYYLFGVGREVTIYNLGVKCQTISASEAGCVGVVVSKKLLVVNFARNDVLTECPVMKEIRMVLDANRAKKVRKSPRRLTRDERISVLLDIRDGVQSFKDVKLAGLLYSTSGQSLTLTDIRNCRTFWSFGEDGDVSADKLMQSGQALVIDRSLIDAINYYGEPEMFFSWLTSNDSLPPNFWAKTQGLYRSLDSLKSNMNEQFSFVPREKWTRLEKRVIKVLEGLDCWDGRAIVIGLGASYNGWTDGMTYIAIERSFLASLSVRHSWGAVDLFTLLLHECAHTDPTHGTHVHGEEFYRNFHNLVRYGDKNHRVALRYVDQFVTRVRSAPIEEKNENAIKQEQKAKARIRRKLSAALAADSSGGVSITSGGTVKRKRGRPRRHIRMPIGAE